MKRVSIILPVYNGEKYLKRCIESLLSQKDVDMSELEIVAINDGSSDNSLSLLLKYEKNHPKIIRLIDQKNAGTAATRNRGITEALGTYVTFVDQDDYVDADFISHYDAALATSEYDIVVGGFKLVDRDERAIKIVYPSSTNAGRLHSIPGWAKLYNRNFLIKNQIEFFANNIGEDNVFTAQCIAATRNYRTIAYAGYNNFFDNEANVTNTQHRGLSENIKILRLLDELATVKTTDKDTEHLLSYNIVRTGVYYLLAYGKQATPERFTAVFHEISGWIDAYKASGKQIAYAPLGMPGDALSARAGIILFYFLKAVNLVGLFAQLYCRRNG